MKVEDLIQGCIAGDPRCQEYLVRTHAPKLLAICKRYTRDSESANDALQETFINIFKYVKGFKGKGSFEGWMRRIAVNCSISFQKKHFLNYYEEEVSADNTKNAQIPDVYSNLGAEEILGLLDQLPKSLYLVFNMNVVEGYSHKEIGKALGISESTSRASLSRARVWLIKIMEANEAVEKKSINQYKLSITGNGFTSAYPEAI